MNLEQVKRMRKYMLENFAFVSWPPFAMGNCVMRIIQAHTEDYYWTPKENVWKPDPYITSSLDYPETQDYQETLHGRFWTTAHTSTLFRTASRSEWDPEELLALINKTIAWEKDRTLPTPDHVVDLEALHITYIKKDKKSVEASGHVPPHIWLQKQPETKKLVNLYYEKDNHNIADLPTRPQTDLITTQWSENLIEDERVLNISLNMFFSPDWYEYESEFDRLSKFLNFTYPRKKAVRAYMHYYKERIRLYNDRDTEEKKRTYDKRPNFRELGSRILQNNVEDN